MRLAAIVKMIGELIVEMLEESAMRARQFFCAATLVGSLLYSFTSPQLSFAQNSEANSASQNAASTNTDTKSANHNANSESSDPSSLALKKAISIVEADVNSSIAEYNEIVKFINSAELEISQGKVKIFLGLGVAKAASLPTFFLIRNMKKTGITKAKMTYAIIAGVVVGLGFDYAVYSYGRVSVSGEDLVKLLKQLKLNRRSLLARLDALSTLKLALEIQGSTAAEELLVVELDSKVRAAILEEQIN